MYALLLCIITSNTLSNKSLIFISYWTFLRFLCLFQRCLFVVGLNQDPNKGHILNLSVYSLSRLFSSVTVPYPLLLFSAFVSLRKKDILISMVLSSIYVSFWNFLESTSFSPSHLVAKKLFLLSWILHTASLW